MANSHINMSQKATVGKGRSRNGGPGEASSSFQPRGFFEVEHWRHGLLMATYRFKNGITNEGKDHIFNVHFDVVAKVTIWYMLLVDNANFTALNAADTYDDIDQAGNGWDEFKTYTDNANASDPNTRPVWNPDPASGQSISNGTQTIFDITGTATVKGLGIVGGGASSNTKGNHAADGFLWATALFDQGDTAVVNGDQLKITYTVSA
jgi:hypothetical protein